MCVTARLEVAGRKSPVFKMHGKYKGWYESLAAGTSGKLTVKFEPNYHGKEGLGHQKRQLVIMSNDRRATRKLIELFATVMN